jgi:threonine dehydrogenase-like Zn-dependent dehydrogenase
MLSVPEHSVVWRLPNHSGLAVKRQISGQVSHTAIIIRMLSAAVCGTDLAILSGTRPDHAEILGHEGVGVVLHAPEHCGMSKGERVIINPVHRKRPEIVIGHSCDGVFRGLFCVDAADAVEGGLLVSCPKECSLADEELALTEPIASVLYSLDLLQKQCGTSSLLIRGSGTVGILAAKLWAMMTGSAAILVSKSEAHARWLQKSTSWPANVRICSAQSSSTIRECSSDAAPKAAVLCCSREGAPEGLRWLMDVVPEGAIIDLMAGFPADYREGRLSGVNLDGIRWNNIRGANGSPPTAVVDQSSGKTVYLMGHRGTAERHIFQGIELLSRKVISMADIPHRLLTLEQLPGAVSQMLATETRHNTKWVKAIVSFSQADRGEPIGAR